MDLSEISSDDLADELEKRDFVIFNDLYHMLAEASDDEIIDEYDDRGLQHFNEVEDAVYFIETKGYEVHEKDRFKDTWEDIYKQVLTLSRDNFMQWLDRQFVKHIEKWI